MCSCILLLFYDPGGLEDGDRLGRSKQPARTGLEPAIAGSRRWRVAFIENFDSAID